MRHLIPEIISTIDTSQKEITVAMIGEIIKSQARLKETSIGQGPINIPFHVQVVRQINTLAIDLLFHPLLFLLIRFKLLVRPMASQKKLPVASL
jgi:hypothetical protein